MAPAKQDTFEVIGILSEAVLCPACLRGSHARWCRVALKSETRRVWNRSKPRGYAALNNGGVGLMKLAMLAGIGCFGASYFVRWDRSPLSTDARTFSR